MQLLFKICYNKYIIFFLKKQLLYIKKSLTLQLVCKDMVDCCCAREHGLMHEFLQKNQTKKYINNK